MFKHLHQLSARRLFFNGGCQSSHASKKFSHTSKKSSHASKISGCSSLSSFVNSECNNDFKHLNFFRSVPVTYLYTLAFSRTRPAPMVSSNT